MLIRVPGNLRRKALPPTSFEERLASYNILSADEVQGAADFIRKCLQLEYTDRPTAQELQTNDWLWGWVCSGH